MYIMLMDTSLLDKAIVFAVNAHSGLERKGKGFPYIVHPMEAASIAATRTNDQELLAAAVLHDTVEDTEVTLKDIEREFGPRALQNWSKPSPISCSRARAVKKVGGCAKRRPSGDFRQLQTM